MGIESAKMADIEMVDPLDAIPSASSKRFCIEANRCKKNMSILVAAKIFRFFEDRV